MTLANISPECIVVVAGAIVGSICTTGILLVNSSKSGTSRKLNSGTPASVKIELIQRGRGGHTRRLFLIISSVCIGSLALLSKCEWLTYVIVGSLAFFLGHASSKFGINLDYGPPNEIMPASKCDKDKEGKMPIDKDEPMPTPVEDFDGVWVKKNGHYYLSEGQIIDLSEESIKRRIQHKDYNYVTRPKGNITEIDRELMLTDLLFLAADGPMGVESGGKPWDHVHYEQDGGIHVSTIVVEGSQWQCFRVTGRMQAAPMDVCSLVINDARIGEYDEMFGSIQMIERVNERAAIRHSYYKPIWPTAPRDFVIITTWEPLPDGRVVVATRSVEHPLVASRTKDHVRARVLCAGYVLEPVVLEDGRVETDCTVIIHTDVSCDWLPAAFVNPFTNTRPVGYVQAMQRICREEFGSKPVAAVQKKLAASSS
eukprot:CAMPEP_0113944926 /NCGR_PEP_ID=MMETSP1339-20121228/37922_1 /TAXON_ID=94617 /ORGANISM="Fibrocapsa japonica" /LENGTH=425 /DNA_ID=CAMNT_0000950293 /DNA_START=202 /DNA_END=1479 /DNA_ORIENTATION=- /assembly_acc=CAM_ASM_000762